jgi:hypothetical protein
VGVLPQHLKPKTNKIMSTYYGLRTPMTKNEMSSIGVKFDDGLMVDENNKNYLHPQYIGDSESMYGFTRYAGNSADYLVNLLDKNGIDWMCEYDLDDCYPIYEIAEELGVEINDEDDSYDEFHDIVFTDWYTEDYYWVMKDGKSEEYIREWCKENKEQILSSLSENNS